MAGGRTAAAAAVVAGAPPPPSPVIGRRRPLAPAGGRGAGAGVAAGAAAGPGAAAGAAARAAVATAVLLGGIRTQIREVMAKIRFGRKQQRAAGYKDCALFYDVFLHGDMGDGKRATSSGGK